MSLDSDLNLTVRQKVRFGSDAFVGCFHIPLNRLHISKQPIKNWYKLGPKPGKVSTKLRGDLLVTVQFLSIWNKADTRAPYSHPLEVELSRRPARMLRRSKSEYHAKSNRDPFKSSVEKSTKPKEKISGVFKRSFRKKNSQVFEDCDDDFVSLAVRSPDSPPTPPLQNNRKKMLKPSSSNQKGAESSSSESFTHSESSTQDSLTSNSLVMFTEASKLNNTSGIIDLWRADPDVRREIGRQQLEKGTGRNGEEKEDVDQKKKSPIFRSNVYNKPRPQSMLSLPISFKKPTPEKSPGKSDDESSNGPVCTSAASSDKNSLNSSPMTESPSRSPTITYRAHSFRRPRKRGNSMNQDNGSVSEVAGKSPGTGTPGAEDTSSKKELEPAQDADSATNDQSSSTSGYFSGGSTAESLTPSTSTGHPDSSDTSVDSHVTPTGERPVTTSDKPDSQKELKHSASDRVVGGSEHKGTATPARTSASELRTAEVNSRLEDESHPISPVSGIKQNLRPRILPFVGSPSATQGASSSSSPGRKRVSRAASLAVDNVQHPDQPESEKLLPEAVPLRKKRSHTKSLGVSTNFDWKRRSADIAELRKLNGQSNTDGLGNIMSLQAPLRELILQKKAAEPQKKAPEAQKKVPEPQKKVSEPQKKVSEPQKKVPEVQSSDSRAAVASSASSSHATAAASSQPGIRSSRTTGQCQVPSARMSKQTIPAPRPVKPHSSALHGRAKAATVSIKSSVPPADSSCAGATASLDNSAPTDAASSHDNQGTKTPPVEQESLEGSRSTTPPLGHQQLGPSASVPVGVSMGDGGALAPPNQDEQRKSSDEQMRRLKHTVMYKKTQGKPLPGVSLLPPSFSSKSATLPSRGKFASAGKDIVATVSSIEPAAPVTQASATANASTNDARTEMTTPAPSPVPTITPDVLSPVSEQPSELQSIPSSQPLSPVGEGEDPTLHEDAVLPVALSPLPSETPVHRSSTSSVPSTSQVAKAFLDVLPLQRRKQGGGLKRAMSLYQENKRQAALVREKMILDTGAERATHSAGNSPRVRRRDTIDGMNSLRRLIMRHSRVATPPLVMQVNGSRSSTPDSSATGGTGSPLSFRRISETHGHFLRFPTSLLSTSPAPHDSASGALSPVSVTDGPSKGLDLHPAQEEPAQPTATCTCSSTEAERLTRPSAGDSASLEMNEKSSVEEEELTEQDLQGWSKEDLIHELLRTRSNYVATKKESDSMQEYLGDLLAKVMHHSPELLQCTHAQH